MNKDALVTHAVSHERGLQTPTPAQGNIALREQQGTKGQPVLAGHEGLPLLGCLQFPGGAQPCGHMPVIGHVTPSLGSLLPGTTISQDRQG